MISFSDKQQSRLPLSTQGVASIPHTAIRLGRETFYAVSQEQDARVSGKGPEAGCFTHLSHRAPVTHELTNRGPHSPA
jgi:hypothetical protein